MTDPRPHKSDCECIYCRFPFMKDVISDVTEEYKLMKTFISSVRAEDSLFDVTQPRVSHWASEGFRQCNRLAWLKFTGVEPTNVGGTSGDDIMQQGIDIEGDIIETYKTYGLLLSQRVFGAKGKSVTVLDPRLKRPLVGKTDLIIVENDQWVPIEIKSTKDWGGDNRYCYECKRQIRGSPHAWLRFKPTVEHVAQLTTYLKGWKDKVVAGRRFASYGYLQYKNRNTGADFKLKIEFSDEFYEKLIEYYVGLEADYEKPDPPPIPSGLSKDRFPCSWTMGEETVRCQFWDLCWGAKADLTGLLQKSIEAAKKARSSDAAPDA